MRFERFFPRNRGDSAEISEVFQTHLSPMVGGYYNFFGRSQGKIEFRKGFLRMVNQQHQPINKGLVNQLTPPKLVKRWTSNRNKTEIN